VRFEWTQYSAEINLSVALPAGTRARDLVVAVQPFEMCISLRGYGVILRGSLHRGVRHRETVWTIEEGQLRLLLVKLDHGASKTIGLRRIAPDWRSRRRSRRPRSWRPRAARAGARARKGKGQHECGRRRRE
jgi:hypothetical protein